MDWSKAKTWLIILFACVNVFLIYMLIQDHYETSVISDDTVAKTVQILAENSITVDKAAVPKDMPKLGNVEVVNAVGSADEIAGKILGSGYVSEADGRFTKGGKTLSMSGDEITYTNTEPDTPLDNITAANASAYAANLLSNMGFDMSKATGTLINERSDGGIILYNIKLMQKLDIYALFDSVFTVTIGENGIVYLNGSWFSMTDSGMGGSVSRVSSACSALLDFSAYAVANGKPYTIQEISLGYTTGAKDDYHKAISAAPVWRIVTDSETYYHDAI